MGRVSRANTLGEGGIQVGIEPDAKVVTSVQVLGLRPI